MIWKEIHLLRHPDRIEMIDGIFDQKKVSPRFAKKFFLIQVVYLVWIFNLWRHKFVRGGVFFRS